MNPQDLIKQELIMVMNPQGGFSEIHRPARDV